MLCSPGVDTVCAGGTPSDVSAARSRLARRRIRRRAAMTASSPPGGASRITPSPSTSKLASRAARLLRRDAVPLRAAIASSISFSRSDNAAGSRLARRDASLGAAAPPDVIAGSADMWRGARNHRRVKNTWSTRVTKGMANFGPDVKKLTERARCQTGVASYQVKSSRDVPGGSSIVSIVLARRARNSRC